MDRSMGWKPTRMMGWALLACVSLACTTVAQAQAATASAPDGASEAAAGLAYARQFAAAHAAPLPTAVTATTLLKARPSSASPTVNTVHAGTVVLAYGCQGSPGWCEVAYGNAQFGWIALADMDAEQSRQNLQFWQQSHR